MGPGFGERSETATALSTLFSHVRDICSRRPWTARVIWWELGGGGWGGGGGGRLEAHLITLHHFWLPSAGRGAKHNQARMINHCGCVKQLPHNLSPNGMQTVCLLLSGQGDKEHRYSNCVFTSEANWAAKSPEVIHFLWARATKATQATNATSGKSWATRATKKSWRRLNFTQITMTRFGGKTLTADRNVDALRLRGSQGTPALWYIMSYLSDPKRTTKANRNISSDTLWATKASLQLNPLLMWTHSKRKGEKQYICCCSPWC